MMGINFHHNENRNAYTTREADISWRQTMRDDVQSENISNA